MPLIDRETDWRPATDPGKGELHDAYPAEGKVEYESQLRLVVGCIVAKVHMARHAPNDTNYTIVSYYDLVR